MAMKNLIRRYALGLGVDDVGFAAVSDYHSPKSPAISSIFPAAKSIIVMAINEMSHCESTNPQIAMAGRLDVMEYIRHCNFELARYLERELNTKAMSIPASYPLELSPKTKGAIADISLRHAAVAAGLGRFGRHNLVIHPRLGARVLFCGVLSDLDLPSDPPVQENPCLQCDICVESCPAGALSREGFTDVGKCLQVSQPYGLRKSLSFWSTLVGKTPEEQKKMIFSEDYWKMYHAQMIGFQYYCFKCYAGCPIVKTSSSISDIP